MGGYSDILFGISNSLSDSGFPFIMFGFFDVKVINFNFVFESHVSVEVLESLEEVSNWRSNRC